MQRRGLDDASFDGGYGQVAWALTGESHRYNPQAGSYLRLFPNHPFSVKDGGIGAIELAARVSYIDLVDNYDPLVALSSQSAAVNGGRQTGYSLAVNWYPNDLLRFMLDYNHVDFNKRNGLAATGAPLDAQVGTRFDALSLR